MQNPETPVTPDTDATLAIESGALPSVRTARPIVDPAIVEGGALWNFDHLRPKILTDVVSQTAQELGGANLDMVLGEALYNERVRLRRNRPNIFTRARHTADKRLWGGVHSGLLKSSAHQDRKELLNRVLSHYAEEIGGQFNPDVYRMSTHAVPFFFDWLLNAASVRKFLPWKMTESVHSKIQIHGQVAQLRKLSEKGTVLLVPTHQSNIDSVAIGYIIYLMGLPPFSYGAGLNLFSNPVLSYFMSRLGAYTVDRQKGNAVYKQVLKNYSTRILREGVHSIFFPGGGRCRSGAIESKLKLGLLGTALDAQLQNLRDGNPKPNVYVVPMVMSYHFVLEASSLIEDYLADAGKHRFIITDDESWQAAKVLKFFWKLFAAESGVLEVRVGQALDVFGNLVDDEGRSIGPNGTFIDAKRLLTTRGELRPDADRDREYTRRLGERISERFHAENTVLDSHLVAFAYFEALRKKYPDLDLYRFLRISHEQRSMPLDQFIPYAEEAHRRVRELADRGQLHLSSGLKTSDTRRWVLSGIGNLGIFHEAAVLKVDEGTVTTEDMPLLYYYRNRLSGYGLRFAGGLTGARDGQGFLA